MTALAILILVGAFAVFIAHDLDRLARRRREAERRKDAS